MAYQKKTDPKSVLPGKASISQATNQAHTAESEFMEKVAISDASSKKAAPAETKAAVGLSNTPALDEAIKDCLNRYADPTRDWSVNKILRSLQQPPHNLSPGELSTLLTRRIQAISTQIATSRG